MPPTLLVQLPFLTLRVFLCLDPSPPWDLFSALAHILICCLILSPSVFKLDADSGFVNHEQGTHIAACAVSGVYLLMLAKPLRNFKYIGNGEGSMQSDKAWWEEYFNVVCIPYSPRLIGWSHQVRALQVDHRYISDSFDYLQLPGEEYPSLPTTIQAFIRPPLYSTCSPVHDLL